MEGEVRKSYQIRALFRKSAALQLRQKATNCCQILTPILCLLLVYLIKSIAESQIEKNETRPVVMETIPRILNPPLVPNYILYNLVGLSVTTCEQWYYYSVESQDPYTHEFVGSLTGEHFNPDNKTERAGLLGKIPNFFCKSNAKNNPYFAKPQSSINQDIYNTLKVMNDNPLHHHQSMYISMLPDGAVTFYNASRNSIKYKAQINDQRFFSYHRQNGVTKLALAKSDGSDGTHLLTITDGMLTLIDMLHQALFRQLFDDTEIMTLVQYMPITVHESAELNRLLNVMGASLYPIALSLLLPVFMYSVVLEKEERLQDFMKMNGMRITNYWVVNFSFNYIIYSVTILVFLLFGSFVVKLQFFTQTNTLLMCLLFGGWGISQIALAFFIQVFISKARTATIWGYLLSIWTVLWGITLNLAVFPYPQEMPWYILLYPHFALTRAIYNLSYNCGYYKCVESFSEVSSELSGCLASLYLVGITILLASIYLNEVVPKEYGVPKHPLFCLRKKQNPENESYEELLDEEENQDEDRTVKDENRNIREIRGGFGDFPLIVKDLRKVYKSKTSEKVAVRKLCLRVNEGEMLGLLGPNGAGKTTLISMLTGLYRPDSGNAWVGGFDIIQSIDQVQLRMGVCPQFDILWPELTVYEHLLFYARLKGIPPSEEELRVASALQDVYLDNFRHLKTKELSGGMRRRLSVAISLVGDPKIVFLDEPTTGLDPENRRQLWEILAICRKGRAMVLTTHSMEEADVLSSRVAIMHLGVLRCIGPQVVLKSVYGGGFHLYINCHKPGRINFHSQEEVLQQVETFVAYVLPEAKLVSEFNGNIVYQVPQEHCRVSKVFKEFEENKDRVGIADWGISQSSLEDVFLRVIENYQ